MSVEKEYTKHWDDKFRSREWGRYPPEDLVRFMGRNFKHAQRDSIRVLEVGCGPGANLWFLHREGFATSGIDISPTAIELAGKRLQLENIGCNSMEADLRVGNFNMLPWSDNYFDVVVDIFALYANPIDVIARTLSEIARVLKPGGLFYVKLWGTNTTGYGTGRQIEPNTFESISSGPCCNMGLSHFFNLEEIDQLFGQFFTLLTIDVVSRSNNNMDNQKIEEFHCQFRKDK